MEGDRPKPMNKLHRPGRLSDSGMRCFFLLVH
ncbi:MAG: hypothetical protein K0R67_1488 [Paenibacillus sp.]|nr:hypothetical protein [Paenibacillus sp.]